MEDGEEDPTGPALFKLVSGKRRDNVSSRENKGQPSALGEMKRQP
jgi:hypothetical protein